MRPVESPSTRAEVVSVGGEVWRVIDEGVGPPVLLVHGFPDRAEVWRGVVSRLRAAGGGARSRLICLGLVNRPRLGRGRGIAPIACWSSWRRC
jgi:pimeloyl-ACP methyl ester carboxylesterase